MQEESFKSKKDPIKFISIGVLLLGVGVMIGVLANSGADKSTIIALNPPTKTATQQDQSAQSSQTASQKNAGRSADRYLALEGFSRTGLIKQLEFEGYSPEDAAYGTDSQMVDWYAQSVRSAKKYLDIMPFSHSALVKQLEFEGYTPEQAENGVIANGL